MTKVSVVIPCFNLGQYINEAVDSVKAQTYQDFEIVVVNDGSTDLETKKIIENLDAPKIKILTTSNQGLASARNNGIESSCGKYILPLDADDRIAPTYLEKAVGVLEKNENTGIVYCQARFFGAKSFEWDLPSFELSRMMIDNLIFCSAFFRRKDWEAVGGYNPNMVYGWEDYDFWLSLIELGKEVYRIPETLFFYRARKDSMVNSMSEEKLLYSYKQLGKNHKKLYIDNIDEIFSYIYSLRHIIKHFEQDLIARDTKIHNLNLDLIHLNETINQLMLKNSELTATYSDWRTLIKHLIRIIFNK